MRWDGHENPKKMRISTSPDHRMYNSKHGLSMTEKPVRNPQGFYTKHDLRNCGACNHKKLTHQSSTEKFLELQKVEVPKIGAGI